MRKVLLRNTLFLLHNQMLLKEIVGLLKLGSLGSNLAAVFISCLAIGKFLPISASLSQLLSEVWAALLGTV